MRSCLGGLAWVAVAFASLPVAAQTEQVRFGNLHSHTSCSDGSGTPAEAYTMACAQDGIDFFAITEHNHYKGDGKGDRRDDILIFNRPDLYRGTPGPENPRISHFKIEPTSHRNLFLQHREDTISAK